MDAIQDTCCQKVTSMSLDDPMPVRSRYVVRIARGDGQLARREREPPCSSSAVVRFRPSTSAAVAVSSQLVLEGLREQLGSTDSPLLRKGGYTLQQPYEIFPLARAQPDG